MNLKRKQYAILNKVYDKETYEKMKAEIVADMKKRPFVDNMGKRYYYGEFFAPEFSKFAYNTSNASKYFWKTKEEVEAGGYFWYEEEAQNVESTISGSSLPETLAEVTDAIMNEAIACTTCDKKYRIAPLELSILRKLNMPLPTRCPKCREAARFKKINLPILRDANCGKCGNDIKTAFPKEFNGEIYCVDCYQKAIQ